MEVSNMPERILYVIMGDDIIYNSNGEVEEEEIQVVAK